MQKITTQTYSQFIARGTRIVVVTAAWAGHSRMFMPVVETVERELRDCELALLDSDLEPELTDSLTKAVPSTHVFVDGRQVRSIIGAVSTDELRTALHAAGVHFERESLVVPLRATAASGRLSLTQDFMARAEVAARADREALASCVRTDSWVAAYGSAAQIEASVEQALLAIRELPELMSDVESAALDEDRRAVNRLGSLAGLLYGAATFDVLADMLPASYGYLDDWLVLRATKHVYVVPPSAAQRGRLADMSRLIWNCLPPRVIAPLAQFVGYMEHERAMLEKLPEPQLRAMLDGHLKRPAPMQFVIPAVKAAEAPRDPLGGWTADASVAEWSDARPLHFRFNDGSSVAMTRSGRVVGES